MPNVEVGDIPAEVHRELTQRAEQAGQPLQHYLASQLEMIAAIPTLDEALDRIEQRPKGALSAVDAIAALEDDRARR